MLEIDQFSELWFVCDIRDKSKYRGGPVVLEKATKKISQNHKLVERFFWPTEENVSVYIMKYIRKE